MVTKALEPARGRPLRLKRQTVEVSCRPAASAAKTAALTADSTCHVWTTVEYQPSARTTMDGPGRLAYTYGTDAPRSKRMPVGCPIGQPTGELTVTAGWVADLRSQARQPS